MPGTPFAYSNSREQITTPENVDLFQTAAASSRWPAKLSLIVALLAVVACSGPAARRPRLHARTMRSNIGRHSAPRRFAATRMRFPNTTRFPFVVNAVLDESEAQHIARKDFPGVFPKLLEADPGTSPAPTTMKSFLSTTPRFSRSFCNTHGNQFRVGAWVFELTPQGCVFVQAFVDE